MNFYQAQDSARKQTRVLIALFALAVVCLVVLSNLLLIAMVWFSDLGNLIDTRRPSLSGLPLHQAIWQAVVFMGWHKIAIVSAIIVLVISVATWSKWHSLSAGGHVVAESLGGRLLNTNSMQRHERRLLNVVEEMALAATITVPPVYVLQNESGINAFAAGLSVDDAVLAFSEGAMEDLNREQLQGVAGHEFSHILNGDMRLNVRILATLHGLLMINKTGRVLIDLGLHSGSRSRRNQKNAGALLFLIAGGALWALGTAGQFFGAMIKAALSRQREFLADASAVQFTRNPQGIAGALRVIATNSQESRIRNPRAHELGHIFFSFAYKSHMFATHPPLKERIKRLMPAWDGSYLPSNSEADFATEGGHENVSGFASMGGGTSATQAKDYGAIDYVPGLSGAPVAAVQAPTLDAQSEFNSVKQIARSAEGAQAAFLAYFAKHSSFTDAKALEWIAANAKGGDADVSGLSVEKGFSALVGDIFGRLCSLSMQQSLDVLRIGVASLKSLEKTDYLQFRALVIDLVQADKKRSVSEWVGFELMTHACDHHFGLRKVTRPKHRTINAVQPFFEIILSKFIAMGNAGSLEREAALQAAAQAGGLQDLTLREKSEMSSKQFMQAVEQVKYAFPLLKPRLIKALLAAAKADGEFVDIEVQLITVLAAIWDLPLPVLELETATLS